jgi:hypothetical protein
VDVGNVEPHLLLCLLTVPQKTSYEFLEMRATTTAFLGVKFGDFLFELLKGAAIHC